MTADHLESLRPALRSDREPLSAATLTWPILYRLVGIASSVGLDESLPRAALLERDLAEAVLGADAPDEILHYRLAIDAERAGKIACAIESGARLIAEHLRPELLALVPLLRQGLATLLLIGPEDTGDELAEVGRRLLPGGGPPVAAAVPLDTFAGLGRRLFLQDLAA